MEVVAGVHVGLCLLCLAVVVQVGNWYVLQDICTYVYVWTVLHVVKMGRGGVNSTGAISGWSGSWKHPLGGSCYIMAVGVAQSAGLDRILMIVLK